MNGFSTGPIGIMPEVLDEAKFAKVFPGAPAGSFQAYEAANRRRTNNKSQPPLRRQVQAAKSEPSKGSEPTMPAAAPVKPEPKATAAAHRVSMPNVIAPNLKAFDSPQEGYRAGMALRASVGRFTGNRDATAEVFLRERGLEVFNTVSVSDPTKGGYAVQDELSAAIIKNIGRYGYARILPTYLPMTSGRITAPVEVSGPTVYYVNELGQITTSDAVWGQVSVEPRKRATISYISAEEDADSLVRYTDSLVDSTARAHARAEDREFVAADGTSAFGGAVGLLGALAAGGIVESTGANAWDELTMAHFGALVAKLPEQYCDGTESFICSSAFYALGMLRAAGGAAQGFAPDGTPLYMGKKVHLMAAMPASSAASTLSCLFGNWRESAAFGDRGLTFTFSDKSPEVFSKDLIAVRCVNRSGASVHGGGTATDAGAYVGLRTAAS